MRLTANPGLSLTTIGVLPSCFTNAVAAATVASPVCNPRTSSTSAIIGTGLKKCTPRNAPGRFIAAASVVMEMDDVLDAISASARTSASACRRILSLSSRFSVAASTTRSHPARSS